MVRTNDKNGKVVNKFNTSCDLDVIKKLEPEAKHIYLAIEEIEYKIKKRTKEYYQENCLVSKS